MAEIRHADCHTVPVGRSLTDLVIRSGGLTPCLREALRASAQPTSHTSLSGALVTLPRMDMLTREQIAAADLTDWRKLGQGIHARYVVGDFASGVRFLAAVGAAGDALGHHPRVAMGEGY